jgi:uncharacterized membrane protein YdbT with pleckstrin-like domain
MSTPAPNIGPERTLRSFRESKWRLSFWLKSIFTLGIWYLTVYRHNHLTLTTEKIVQRRGNWLTANETALYIRDIRDVTTNQSVLGRIFGYGDISLSSSGGAGSEISARGLSDAVLLKDFLFDLRDGRADEARLQQMITTK